MDMRRVVILSFAAVLLLCVPTLAPAAGLFGMGMPGLGGFSGSSCSGGPGVACCPAVYFGYNIEQNRSRTPATFGLTNRGDFAEPLGQNELRVTPSDPSGFWLGVSQYCQLGERLGIMASGWYLFPTTGNASELYDPIGAPLDPRLWSANKSEGWIDGALLLGSTCGLNLIGGFRWDSLNIQLRNPVTLDAFVVQRGSLADEANLTANWYIPFLGTQACCGGPCCGLLVRVIGTPWVPGTVRYGETGFAGAGTRLDVSANFNRAAFIEVFAEASTNAGGLGCFGIFGRFNYIDGTATTSPTLVGTGIPYSTFDLVVRRSSWTIGGKVALNFDLPF